MKNQCHSPLPCTTGILFLKRRGGFTLIELLVVVLIIGILAAVAVPQYQKAVEKAKATQALVTLKAVYQAYTAYYLEKGMVPSSFSQLDVSIPWTPSNESDTVRSNEDWNLGLTTTAQYAGIILDRKRGPYVNSRFYIWHFYHNNATMDRLSGSIMCAEVKQTYSGTKKGDYCVKLFHATFIMGGSTNYYYQMPSL